MGYPTYAIVDIEATSGSVGTGEKMIQFACVLIRDGKEIESFDTLVNPSKAIPKKISRLTGIKDSDVKGAPYFEEIGEILQQLLEDTVFVAHNLSFDLRFLNEQFQLAGLEKINNLAIDTVTLSKILFPKAPSYNLQELTAWLGYDLDQAHNALADAKATAFLLRKILEKANNLPLITVEKINELAGILNFDNDVFFQQLLNRKLNNKSENLREDIVVYQDIALIDPALTALEESLGQASAYPYNEKDKRELFKNTTVDNRLDQMTMMNQFHDYLTDSPSLKKLAIEAPAGIGKSIAYLLPLMYLENGPGKTVISTNTKVLQDQLLEESFPRLDEILPFNRSFSVLKGKENYLSLAKFIQLLRMNEKNRSEDFYAMQVLVWLTETLTGDLDELHLTSKVRHPFWNSVRIRSTKKSFPEEEKYDFYSRLLANAKRADIVVTNHAFLLNDLAEDKGQRFFSSIDRLIIDEAHHFPKALVQASKNQLIFSSFIQNIKEFMNKETDETLIGKGTRIGVEGFFTSVQVQLLQSSSELLFEQIKKLKEDLDHHFINSQNYQNSPKFWVEVEITEKDLLGKIRNDVKNCLNSLENLHYYIEKIIDFANDNKDQFSNNEKVYLIDLAASNRLFDKARQVLKASFVESNANQYKWLSFQAFNPINTLTLQVITPDREEEIIQELQAIPKIIFTSSTLAVDGSIQAFQSQVQPMDLEFTQYGETYHYNKQVKILVPKTNLRINDLSHQHQVQYVAKSIEAIYQDFIDFPIKTLGLFHSLDLLEDVYRTLDERGSVEPHKLLGQEISGSKQKVLKQFKQAQSSLLLGADTYFEGIDLPGSLLELVILPKIPFDSPNFPLVKYRSAKLQGQSKDLFNDLLLPDAIIKMKQAMGRLIRQSSDKGLFIVLDNRFLHANYAQTIKRSFPQGVEIEEVEIKDMASIILDYITDR